MKEKLILKFKEVFGNDQNIKTYFTPGRVNLIGEHTDYNGGHVFPCSLSMGTYAVARKNNLNALRLYSINFEEVGLLTSKIEDEKETKSSQWIRYPKGVIWAFKEKGYEIKEGLDILYFGDIPHGAGLSSSASIEVLTGYILKDLFDFDVSMIDIALLSQKAENEYVGVNCGIMDQFVISMGKKEHAIFLDTQKLEYQYVPLDLAGYSIVIMNTNKQRGLTDSKYNERRAECEKGLKQLQKIVNIQELGNLKEEQFLQYQDEIKDPIIKKRVKHAVLENIRTIKAVEALRNNNLELLGQLINQSHDSLKEDYEVTGMELDTIVEEARKQQGVLGARMTGAGFGGCAIAIVKEENIEEFTQNVRKGYKEKIGYDSEFYIVKTGDGPKVM